MRGNSDGEFNKDENLGTDTEEDYSDVTGSCKCANFLLVWRWKVVVYVNFPNIICLAVSSLGNFVLWRSLLIVICTGSEVDEEVTWIEWFCHLKGNEFFVRSMYCEYNTQRSCSKVIALQDLLTIIATCNSVSKTFILLWLQVEVDDEYIQDDFNLTYLNREVQNYDQALNTILDYDDQEDEPVFTSYRSW